MKKEPKIRPQQAGAALLIAIFALLLISVVGIALLISTSADTALAGNYRTSTGAYYAALAGLEEARGRLLLKNPAFIGNTVPSFFPPLAMNTVLYILNPNTATGESVNPTDSSNPYADKEYDAEFAPTWALNSATVYYTNSVSPLPNVTPPLPGPAYKWVRVNPVTEQALGVTVAGPPGNDPLIALYYDGTGLNKTFTGAQALEITALAVMPSGSTKLLQYIVSAVTASPSGGNRTASISKAKISAPVQLPSRWLSAMPMPSVREQAAPSPTFLPGPRRLRIIWALPCSRGRLQVRRFKVLATLARPFNQPG